MSLPPRRGHTGSPDIGRSPPTSGHPHVAVEECRHRPKRIDGEISAPAARGGKAASSILGQAHLLQRHSGQGTRVMTMIEWSTFPPPRLFVLARTPIIASNRRAGPPYRRPTAHRSLPADLTFLQHVGAIRNGRAKPTFCSDNKIDRPLFQRDDRRRSLRR